MAQSSALVMLRTSRPWNRIEPPRTWPGSSSSRITASPVMLLPEPNSPTMPSVSPAPTVRLTPSTARTTPLLVGKSTQRSADRQNGRLVACGGRGIHQRRIALGSSQSRMPSPRKLKPSTTVTMASPGIAATHHCETSSIPCGDHRAPFRCRRHDAEAKKGEPGKGDDGVADVERHENDQWAYGVRNDVAHEYARGLVAGDHRRLNVFEHPLLQHQTACKAGEFRPPHHQHGDDGVGGANPERGADGECQDDRAGSKARDR